jgi:hypothetical protein
MFKRTVAKTASLPAGMTYLSRLPVSIPPGMVLVHNNVRPTRQLGDRGFRAWLSQSTVGLEPCRCNWAADLGQHFIVSNRFAEEACHG